MRANRHTYLLDVGQSDPGSKSSAHVGQYDVVQNNNTSGRGMPARPSSNGHRLSQTEHQSDFTGFSNLSAAAFIF